MDGRVIRVLVCLAVLNVASVCAQTEAPASDPPPPVIDPTLKFGVRSIACACNLGRRPDLANQRFENPGNHRGGRRRAETDLWNPQTAKLTSQAVPFGAPTQKDIMKLIVPKEFQTYPFDMNALMQWLMEHLNKKTE